MTLRTSRGQRIFQGRRAKGQSNPSPQFIQNQSVARQLNQILHSILGVVRVGFTNMTTGQTAANKYFQYNRSNAFDLGTLPDATFLPADFIISNGTMTPTPITGVTSFVAATGVLTWHWNPANADSSQLGGDTPILVVHNRTQDKWTQAFPGVIRSVQPATYTFDTTFATAGDTVDVYLGWVADPAAANAGTSSKSTYVSVTAS